MQLSKVVIYHTGDIVYSFAYSSGKLVFVTVDDINNVSSEAIFRAKVRKVNHANRTAFVEYLPDITGYLNLPQWLKVQDGSIIPVQLSWLGDVKKQAKLRYDWQLVGKYLIYTSNSQLLKINAKNMSKQLLTKLENLLINFPAQWQPRTALEMDTDDDAILVEAKILFDRAVAIKAQDKLYSLARGVPNYCKLLRSFDLAADSEIVTNYEPAYDDLSDWQDAWQLDIISYDKHLDFGEMVLWWQELTHSHVVEMSNGASLEIHTVAGINIIDINSGSMAVSGSRLNMLLLDEVYRQICLRNLQGIILIDVIKNMSENEQQTVVNYLNKLFKRDISKCNVLGFSHSGLLELVRNKF